MQIFIPENLDMFLSIGLTGIVMKSNFFELNNTKFVDPVKHDLLYFFI